MSNNTSDYRIIKTKPRSKKLKPKIDLAAMVSISFLLIVFFMVTKELSRPQAIDLGVPDCGSDYGLDYGCRLMDHRRQITLLLDGDNKVIYYRGLLDFPDEQPKRLCYGKEGIRKELIILKRQILKITGSKDRGAIVIIKPSKKSTYGNLVDILDEMAINEIPTYAIINDFTPEEHQLLASK